MESLTKILPKETAELLLKDKSSHFSGPRVITSKHVIYRVLENLVDEQLVRSLHSFWLVAIEVVCAPEHLSRPFKSKLEKTEDSQIRFLFHGTQLENHSSIFYHGFLINNDHFGQTDQGYIGKGVYLTSDPEYCASYIKNTPGITTYKYDEPVGLGVEFKVLGCIAIVGITQHKTAQELGSTIPQGMNSHCGYVDIAGNFTASQTEKYAKEYAIPNTENIYPRFRITLKRIQREVVWLDPNIANEENSRYVKHLKQVPDIFLYATADPESALNALKRQKSGTEYRAMTAGRGGEKFADNLRREGISCRVLVFCGAVDYHKTWAAQIQKTVVTNSVEEMYAFATWADKPTT